MSMDNNIVSSSVLQDFLRETSQDRSYRNLTDQIAGSESVNPSNIK